MARALAAIGAAPHSDRTAQSREPLPELPPPILSHALSYLPSPLALCYARQVSRKWRDVASADELWRAMYARCAGGGFRGGSDSASVVDGGWRRRTALAHSLSHPHAVDIRPVWGGLDGRLFGAPRSGHAAAVYRPQPEAPEQVLLVGGATTNYAHRRDADIFLPAVASATTSYSAAGERVDEEEEDEAAENCLGRLPAPPIDATNVLDAYSSRWLHTASVVYLQMPHPSTSRSGGSDGTPIEEVHDGSDGDVPHDAEVSDDGDGGGGGGGGGGSSAGAVDAELELTAVLLLIGGQQQEHVHMDVHRLELSTPGCAMTARGTLLAESVCFAPGRWNELDRTRHHVGGWAGHSATVYKQDQVILFGGLQSQPDGRTAAPSNRLCRLDAASGQFLPMEADGVPPSPRWCHSAVMINGAAAGGIREAGGGGGGGGGTGDDGAGGGAGGGGGGEEIHHHHLIVFGGWAYPRSVFLNDLHLLRLSEAAAAAATDSGGSGGGGTTAVPPCWSRLRTLGVPPVPRCQSSVVELEGGLLLVFGGACHASNASARKTADAGGGGGGGGEDDGGDGDGNGSLQALQGGGGGAGADGTMMDERTQQEAAAFSDEDEDEDEDDDDDDDDGAAVAYGDRVVDLGDVQLLDLKTSTWLRCESPYPPLRGGVNALFRVGRKVYISGGMHSDPGARMPTWTGELAEFAALLPAVRAHG